LQCLSLVQIMMKVSKEHVMNVLYDPMRLIKKYLKEIILFGDAQNNYRILARMSHDPYTPEQLYEIHNNLREYRIDNIGLNEEHLMYYSKTM
jgi:hypothetical protein